MKVFNLTGAILIWVTGVSIAHGQSRHSPRFDLEIDQAFFSNGSVSASKVDDCLAQSKALRQEIIENLVRYYEQVGEETFRKSGSF